MDQARIRRKYFPVKTQSGFTIVAAPKARVRRVMKRLFKTVFPRQKGSLNYAPSPARRGQLDEMRRRYDVLHHEWFLISDPKGRPVGWHIGEAEDAVSFYMRSTGILPAHQNQGLYADLLAALVPYLGELGYERITSLHKPTNRRILISKLKRGFDIAGMELTENWGPLVKLVKILPPDRRRAFYRQYGEEGHKPS